MNKIDTVLSKIIKTFRNILKEFKDRTVYNIAELGIGLQEAYETTHLPDKPNIELAAKIILNVQDTCWK